MRWLLRLKGLCTSNLQELDLGGVTVHIVTNVAECNAACEALRANNKPIAFDSEYIPAVRGGHAKAATVQLCSSSSDV